MLAKRRSPNLQDISPNLFKMFHSKKDTAHLFKQFQEAKLAMERLSHCDFKKKTFNQLKKKTQAEACLGGQI